MNKKSSEVSPESAGNIGLGRLGEAAAANYLQENGYQILDRNWRYKRLGELDIVARKAATTVFVEVKTRRTLGAGDPVEAVDARKLNTMKRLGAQWLRQHPGAAEARYDVVGVYWREGRQPLYHWLQDVAA